MASGNAEEPKAAQTQEFDMEWVDHLPGGRAAVPAECRGRFVWLIVRGEMSESCFNEMRTYLRHIVETGMWQQHWDDSPGGVGSS
ncbi:hypothetical protein AB0I84_06160 [Streptomyces spectabilis]|uniref:hypothetical protein n=1 Tax=Streptomyces spectabilis TaxID=68270 RepID=UPI0033E5EDC0